MVKKLIKRGFYLKNLSYYLHNQIRLSMLKMNPLKSGKEIQKKVLKYCNSLKGDKPGHYKYSADCPKTPWASAFAALTLNLIGALDRISKNEKTLWIEYLQSFQDPQTGLFIDPQFKERDKKSLAHLSEHLFAHSSTFIMGALVVLGGKPLYPVKWVHDFKDPVRMEKWLEERPWKISPWLVGNWSYDMGCAMGMDYLITEDDKNLEAMNTYFEWYDKHQSEKTGWWDLNGNAQVREQQYGGYHTLMVYSVFDRAVPMTEKMIDSSLSIQSIDGMFTRHIGGGCCEDMDVIDTLVTIGTITTYKNKEIKRALSKALLPILSKQNSDGGFFDNVRAGRAEFGWKLCSAKVGQSDICSTLFQCFNIALMGEFLNDKDIMDTKWNHHRTYCHCLKKKINVK